jgi:hypothetical protein
MLGSSALTLFITLARGSEASHDDWHTHEHFPERLAIPGFLRASRWRGPSGYFVLYEVAAVSVLTSSAYLERLNHPSRWTREVMKSYRGMTRGLCRIEQSHGHGLGQHALVVRYAKRAPEPERRLRSLSQQAGLGSAALLVSAAKPAMTAEQRIRGTDSPVERVLVMTGYDRAAVAALRENALAPRRFPENAVQGLYRLEYVSSAGDIAAR